MTARVQELIHALRQRIEALRTGAMSETVDAMAELWRICVGVADRLPAPLLRSVVEQHSTFFRPLQRAMETACEIEFVRSRESTLQPDTADWLTRRVVPYLTQTRLHVAEEIRLVPEDLNGPAVMIGCGARPDSTYFLSETGRFTRVVGIDAHADALACARRIAKNIEFELNDGKTFDFSGFVTILIGNLVSPKAVVLHRVRDTCDRNAHVLVRCPAGLGELFFEPVDDWRDWRIAGATEVNWPLLNQTFALTPDG